LAKLTVRADRNDLMDLKSLFVKSNRGELIQLDNFVKLTEQSSPPQLFRFNRSSAATVTAGLAKGVTLGKALDEMDRIAKEVLDETYTTALDGQIAGVLKIVRRAYYLPLPWRWY
jgi:multidrug efflux pump